MRKLIVLGCVLLQFLSVRAQEEVFNLDFFRTMFNNDPAHGFTVGLSQLPTSVLLDCKLYYSETDHGTNVAAYAQDNPPLDVSRSVPLMKGLRHIFFRLENLKPKTNYYFLVEYSIGGTVVGNTKRYFTRTMSNDPNDPISYIAGGDSRLNIEEGPQPLIESITIRKESNKVVSKLNADFVAFGGDYTFGNTEPEWIQWFEDWKLTYNSQGRITPIVAAIGNHEVLPFGCPQCDNSVVHDIFDTPNPDNYYAVNFNGNLLRLYTLNTEMDIAGAQTDWLLEDLANHRNTFWKSAQYHKPIRPHELGKSDNNEAFDNWAIPFYEEQVRLVVECDAHVVKNTHPLYPARVNDGEMICGEMVEQNYARTQNGKGTTYIGEGTWAAIREGDDPKVWTRDLGTINQIKWIFVNKETIEARTVQTYFRDNPNYADNIPELSDENKFSIPRQVSIWEGQAGSVVSITNNGMSPVPSNPCQTVGIENNPLFTKDMLIAPNPSNGTLRIKLGQTVRGSSQVEIYSLNGVLVFKDTFLGNQFQIKLADDTKGSFLVSVKNENGDFMERVIVK